jgi:hypothetical protein
MFTFQSVSIPEYFIITINNNNFPSPKFMLVADQKSHLRMIHTFWGQNLTENKKKTIQRYVTLEQEICQPVNSVSLYLLQ